MFICITFRLSKNFFIHCKTYFFKAIGNVFNLPTSDSYTLHYSCTFSSLSISNLSKSDVKIPKRTSLPNVNVSKPVAFFKSDIVA